jgi:hypothetical protein
MDEQGPCPCSCVLEKIEGAEISWPPENGSSDVTQSRYSNNFEFIHETPNFLGLAVHTNCSYWEVSCSSHGSDGDGRRPQPNLLNNERSVSMIYNSQMLVRRPASTMVLVALMILYLLPLTIVLAQEVDTTPPQLVDFSLSPTSIDVSASPQTITATLRVTDNLSGTVNVQVQFRSPSGGQFQSIVGQLVAGNRQDGTFQGSLSFPQFSENGMWSITNIFLSDLTGNFNSISTAVLQGRGLPTVLNVVSNPTDVTGPTVTGISISPAAVDVSAGSQNITVTLTVTDDLSGAIFTPSATGSFFGFFPVQFRSTSGTQRRYIGNREFTLTSGTPQNGTWQATFIMPQFSEPGTWQIEFLQLRDVASNQRFLNTSNLTALGLPVNLDVASVPSDTTPPQLTGLSFTPTVINTSLSNQSVSVTLNITDDLAGASFTPTTQFISFFEAGVQFRSPSGQQSRAVAFFNAFNLVAGTPQNGTWQGNLFFPRFSEDGTWRINLLQLKDVTRNIVSFDTAALEARGLPTNLVVLRPSLIGDGTISDPAAGGTVSDDTFGIRAQVTFPPGVLSQPTTVSIDVFQDPLDIPTPSGFQGPGTHFVNIELTPQPSFPLPAPGLTVVLPLPNPKPAGLALSLYRIDPATGNLVPAIGVSGLPVIGTVDASGLSATFTGIASLSTVVGLVPETVLVTIDIKPGTFPNPVNCTAINEVIPVAILSTSNFDATTIDAATVRFGKTGAEAAETHKDRFGNAKRHVEDVNTDGLPDLVFHFRGGDTGFNCGNITGESFAELPARLTGKTKNGTAIAGEDLIRLIIK